MDRNHVAALERAIKVAGGTQEKLAAKMRDAGCKTASQQLISYWLNAETRIDVEWWPFIEAATDGAVTRRDLRPDIFPAEHAA